MSEGTADRGGPPAAAAVRTVEEEPSSPPRGTGPSDPGSEATPESDPEGRGPEPAGPAGEAAATGETDPGGESGSADAADAADAAGAVEPEAPRSDRADTPSDGREHPAHGDEGDAAVPFPMGDFRTALVSAVSVDLPNQHPTVVLRESETPRRQLSFSVSLQDGVVLSHALRRIPTPRPLTHELLSEVLKGFEIDVVAVRLVGRRGAVYFAELDLRDRRGRSVHSCRPSDALAVALVQSVPVPILIDNRLFEEAGDVTPAGPARPPA